MLKKCKYFLLLPILLVIFTSTAFAYLDPGTGSFMFQILTALFFGAMYMTKLFWKKISMFISKLKCKIFKTNP